MDRAEDPVAIAVPVILAVAFYVVVGTQADRLDACPPRADVAWARGCSGLRRRVQAAVQRKSCSRVRRIRSCSGFTPLICWCPCIQRRGRWCRSIRGAVRMPMPGLLYLLAMTSLGVYGVIILARLGLELEIRVFGRDAPPAQVVSYDRDGFRLVGVLIASEPEPDRSCIVAGPQTAAFPNGSGCRWHPLFVVYFISGVAETKSAAVRRGRGRIGNRGRFQVEYSGWPSRCSSWPNTPT